MGFLNRILGTHQVKQYALSEAIIIVDQELENFQSKNKEESYRSAVKIHGEIQQLILLIDEFSRKEVLDHAKSSKTVKERFCKLSKKQLESLEPPGRDNSFSFLKSMRLVMDNLGGLTQRQVLHINFFFKEDFRPVGRKMNEINMLLNIGDASGGDYQKAASLFRRMGQIEKEKSELAQSISSDEESLRGLRERTLPLIEKQPDSYALTKTENRLKSVKQDIDSFLAIQKTLKKYAYIAEIRDDLLAMYIESPSSALFHDSDLKIISLVNQAFAMVNEGKIEGDKKLEAILSSKGFIEIKRNELLAAREDLDKEKEIYNKAEQIFEESLKARTNQMAHLDGEIKSLEKSINEADQQKNDAESEYVKIKTELLLLLSRLLNATIV